MREARETRGFDPAASSDDGSVDTAATANLAPQWEQNASPACAGAPQFEQKGAASSLMACLGMASPRSHEGGVQTRSEVLRRACVREIPRLLPFGRDSDSGYPASAHSGPCGRDDHVLAADP